MSSSDSYQSLVDLDKPNAINCPICLEECNDDDKNTSKEKIVSINFFIFKKFEIKIVKSNSLFLLRNSIK